MCVSPASLLQHCTLLSLVNLTPASAYKYTLFMYLNRASPHERFHVYFSLYMISGPLWAPADLAAIGCRHRWRRTEDTAFPQWAPEEIGARPFCNNGGLSYKMAAPAKHTKIAPMEPVCVRMCVIAQHVPYMQCHLHPRPLRPEQAHNRNYLPEPPGRSFWSRGYFRAPLPVSA